MPIDAEAHMSSDSDTIRIIVAAKAEIYRYFMQLGPGNATGVEVMAMPQDALQLKDEVNEYVPQVVLISPDIRNYSPKLIGELARWPDFPIAVVGLVPNAGAWGQDMAANGAVAFYHTPITPAVVDQFVREAPGIVEKGHSAWRAPIVQSGLADTVFGAVAATSWQSGVATFWSTKGGVGKTTLAVETACILSQIGGKRVLLVDANMNGGHVWMHLGIDPKQNNITHLASEFRIARNRLHADTLKRRVVPADQHLDKRTKAVESRLDVLLGITDIEHAGSEPLAGRQGDEFVTELLAKARSMYDFVVVDIGSSIKSGAHIAALTGSDQIVVITSSDRTSIHDNKMVLRRLVDMYEIGADKMHLVVNQYIPETGFSLQNISAYMGMQVQANVPYDPTHAIRICLNQGESFVLNNFDIRRNPPEVEATLRGMLNVAEFMFPPLDAIIKAREEELPVDGKKKKKRLALFRRR